MQLSDMGKFKTVVIDPPWPLETIRLNTGGLRADNPLDYDTMSLAGIAAIPVCDVLDDDAFVFCWTVNRFLPATFRIVEGWGCKYSFTMIWHKNGGPQTPATAQFNGEYVVVGRKGKPKFRSTKAFFTVNRWPRGAHSEKPEGFYDLLRRVTPEPRIDIFNRRAIPGFHTWGDESSQSQPSPSHYQQVLI